MNSALANIPTVNITQARYAIIVHGEIKECFESFEHAAYVYGRFVDQFQPHARHNVLLLKVEPVIEAGEDIGFY
jgi:hypothetical protein